MSPVGVTVAASTIRITVLTFARVRCTTPRGSVGKEFTAPVKSSVPVLMFSGTLDGSTPPWLGTEALRYLPNGRQLQARYYGHQVDSPCMWRVLGEFIAKGSAKDLDTRCVSEIRRPPFALALPPQLSLSG